MRSEMKASPAPSKTMASQQPMTMSKMIIKIGGPSMEPFVWSVSGRQKKVVTSDVILSPPEKVTRRWRRLAMSAPLVAQIHGDSFGTWF